MSGAISQRPDDMLIGSHGAVGREVPSEYILGNIYERAYESSPDGDQAIMFHGTNLDDLWRNGCNGKISRAMPEGHDKMMKRQNGAWAALSSLSLDYAPWSFLVKGWMVAKEKLLGKSKRPNQVLLTGRRGVPYHGIFLSFAHEDYAWVMDDDKAKNLLMMRTSMPYSGEMLARFMRTCPACETFPYEAEALHWESVAGSTEIFTRDRGPVPARAEGNMAVESTSTTSLGSTANISREER